MMIDEINAQLNILDEKIIKHQQAIGRLEDQYRPLKNQQCKLVAKTHGLKEGDLLVITGECVEHLKQRGWSQAYSHGWHLGDLVKFDRMSSRNGECSLDSIIGYGSSGCFPINMVKRMRAIWVASESEEAE